jgi:hypothetical protein
VLDINAQRPCSPLDQQHHPSHEQLVGLLALLHRRPTRRSGLRVVDIDTTRRTVALAGRRSRHRSTRHLDALQRCLTVGTLPTRTSSSPGPPAARHPRRSSYVTRLLAPAGTTPAACRQTRQTELVNDLDPKLTAVALGMNNNGLVRYAADNVARDRLQRRLASPP